MALGDDSAGTDRRGDDTIASGDRTDERRAAVGELRRNAALIGLTIAAGAGLLAASFPAPGPSAVGLFLLLAGVVGGLVEWAVEETGDA